MSRSAHTETGAAGPSRCAAAFASRPLRRGLEALPPASGGAVMGTGIVSLALALDGREALSEALMWVALALWAGLVLLLAARWRRHRPEFVAELAEPASLTAVAGTCVLGERLVVFGWTWAGVALLLVGGVAGLGLLRPVLGRWRRPTVGASFLLTVAIESAAVLVATLAAAERSGALVVVAAALLVAGVGAYLWVLRDFDVRELLVGRGDHWVAGGAIAISALAGGRVVLAIDATGTLGGLRAAASAVAVALLFAALAWLPPLVVCEVARPRLRFSTLRWATVFPLGMYAAAAFTVGDAAGHRWMAEPARAWVWVAVAVWAVVLAGMAARVAAVLVGAHERGGHAPAAGGS